jgi:membrane protein DedA with SNARE-associated domain
VTDFVDTLLHASEHVESWILALADSPWVYVAIFALAVVDAFFPVVPSESIVIAASTASSSTGAPLLVGIWIAAAAGAWCGDQTGRFIGTKIDVRNWKFFQRPRVLKTLIWAEHGLEKRGASLIIAARFIPMGRIAVNLTAGALGYPAKRFMAITAIAAVIWASWGVALGTVAGSIFHDNVLLAVVVGVAGGVVLGYLVDMILSRLGLAAPHLPDLAKEQAEAAAHASDD